MAGNRIATAWLALIIFCALWASGYAVDSEVIHTPNGKPLFEFRYSAEDGNGVTTWDITDSKYDAIRQALGYGAKYWAEVLQDGLQNSAPARINVFGNGDKSVGASSPQSLLPAFTDYTELGAMLIKGWQPGSTGQVAELSIGNYAPYYGSTGADDPAYFYTGPITHLPGNGDQLHLAAISAA